MILGPRFDVDFVRPAPVPPLAIAVLVVALVAAAAAAAWCEQAWRSGRDLASRRATLEAALERGREQAERRRTTARGADPQAQEQAVAVLDELHRPWRALFEQLEADRVGPVHLDQLAIDSRFESLQMQAEARSLGDVLRYVQALPGAGPIAAVQLSSHELRDAPGGRVVSARVVARLDGRASR
ncbi:MAG TPA: hypothetical protein VMU33_10455 [Burkholderiaceae bacterium]|nr:hypothetical protein [Burkholderiaceae bacterium]